MTSGSLARDNNPAPLEASDAVVPETRLFPHLTALQERFVCSYVENGGNARAAARAAGYGPGTAVTYGHRLLSNPLIVRAIYDRTAISLGTHLPAALSKLAKLSRSASSEYVALEASRDLLDRAGLSAPKKVNVSGGVNVTFDLT